MAETSKAKRIIEEAKKRFEQVQEAEADLRRKSLDDLEFLAGNQWPAQALRDRARDQRPALVVNRLDQFVQHIANAQRQNRVSARCFPVDDKGDIETAEVRQGIIRHIEYNSGGTLAYDTAAFYAVAMGFGYWRQITEYSDPRSFDQDIKLERIANPFQAYLGPHTMPDGSDAEWGFIVNDYTKQEYEQEYPRSEAVALDWETIGLAHPGWVNGESIRVVEYYKTEWRDDKLIRLLNGEVRLRSELSDEEQGRIAQEVGEDGKPGPMQRDTRIPSVKWYKLNALEILDETDWPIPKIPIVKVTGHELTVNGKLILKGIVRNLKDAQLQYNFMLSAQTEAVDSSKGQVVMFEGQEEGHEEEWRNLNKQQVLRAKPTDLKGQPLPPPSRLAPNMSIPAMTEARMLASEDLKALTGVYDAALGNRSNETSGRGILARQQQTETANFHFQDNLLLSITHSTRMLVHLMTYIYDSERVVRIVGEDDSQKIVRINAAFSPDMEKRFGQKRGYDFSVGKYDVVCSAGPAFQTRRQEASERMTAAFTAVPQLFQTAGDLYFRAQDWPYAQEIADRIRPRDDKKADIPPQAQQQIAQMGQMVELLTKELNAKNALIENKQMELDSRERIEMAKIKVSMMETQLKLDSQEAIALLQAEIEGIKARIEVSSAQLAEETGRAAKTM